MEKGQMARSNEEQVAKIVVRLVSTEALESKFQK
jgi:hypothetical protein